MQIYLVGGAVRDTLLGKKPNDRDYVVVGATPQQMKKLGFTQVGSKFPVFLHPQTGEEYALARTEQKTSEGYYGFETAFSSKITLKEDLKRRDFTINSMAIDNDGKISDFYGGQDDLANKIIRHTSSSFLEDPLRVIRLARFYARFYDDGFKMDPETLTLAKKIVSSGELEFIPKERFRIELEKVLDYRVDVFFKTLQELDGLENFSKIISKNYSQIIDRSIIQSFFLKKINNDHKIAILFTKFSLADIKCLQQDLSLSNSLYKQICRFSCLYSYVMKKLNDDEVLTMLKKNQALHKSTLIKDDIAVLMQIFKFNHDEEAQKKLKILSKIITSLQDLNAHKLLQNVQNNKKQQVILTEQLRIIQNTFF